MEKQLICLHCPKLDQVLRLEQKCYIFLTLSQVVRTWCSILRCLAMYPVTQTSSIQKNLTILAASATALEVPGLVIQIQPLQSVGYPSWPFKQNFQNTIYKLLLTGTVSSLGISSWEAYHLLALSLRIGKPLHTGHKMNLFLT